MLPAFGLSLLFSIALCVHVVRTGQQMYWLMIILILQPLGGLVYLAAIVLPSLAGGPTARRLGQGAREALDPTREYREAGAARAETPTVHNQMRLARAAAALGHYDEAQALYGQAAQGIHAEDPTLLMGRATALIELGRFDEALVLLDAMGKDTGNGRTPAAALALGRTYEGLGRYAAFLARTGRRDEASEAIAETDRRIAKANPQFRREGRAWRDLAARALTAG